MNGYGDPITARWRDFTKPLIDLYKGINLRLIQCVACYPSHPVYDRL